jgi:hypothetical protein
MATECQNVLLGLTRPPTTEQQLNALNHITWREGPFGCTLHILDKSLDIVRIHLSSFHDPSGSPFLQVTDLVHVNYGV